MVHLKALFSYSENFILQQQEKMAEAAKNKAIVEEIDEANEKIAKQQIKENEDINKLQEQYKELESSLSKEKIKLPVHNTMMSSGENVVLTNDEITDDEIIKNPQKT